MKGNKPDAVEKANATVPQAPSNWTEVGKAAFALMIGQGKKKPETLIDLGEEMVIHLASAYSDNMAQEAHRRRLAGNKVLLSTLQDQAKATVEPLQDSILALAKTLIGFSPSVSFSHSIPVKGGELAITVMAMREMDADTLAKVKELKDAKQAVESALKGVVSGHKSHLTQFLKGLQKTDEQEPKGIGLLKAGRVKKSKLTKEEISAGVIRFDPERTTFCKDGFALQTSVSFRPDKPKEEKPGKVDPDTIRSTAPAI